MLRVQLTHITMTEFQVLLSVSRMLDGSSRFSAANHNFFRQGNFNDINNVMELLEYIIAKIYFILPPSFGYSLRLDNFIPIII